MILVVGFSVLLMTAAGATIILRITRPAITRSNATSVKDLNLKVNPLPEGWTMDADARTKMGPGIFVVLRRSDPEAFMVFGGRDYKERKPRLSELDEHINRVLRLKFEDAKDDGALDVQWLGLKPRRAYIFRAQDHAANGDRMGGECVAAEDKGMAYWSVAWASEKDALALRGDFETVRSKFHLLDPARAWQPKRSASAEIKGDKLPYTMTDVDDIWKEDKTRPAADVDAAADILRVAKLKNPRGGDEKVSADVVTFIVDPSGIPIEDAKRFLEKLFGKEDELTTKTKIDNVTTEPTGEPSPNDVEKTAEVARLRTRNQNVSYFIVLGAVRVKDKVVVVRCKCNWSDREWFEQNFLALAGSLRGR